ncbi:MAG: hypothetical protein QOI11_3672, partial [Candidatus Eremiobacteraeota bacterium]|nr:hypothetical protein [Candidatus Eremiobacteraeota bacterium]
MQRNRRVRFGAYGGVFPDRRLGPIAGGEMRRSFAYKAAMTREEFEAIYTLRFEHEVEFG